MEDDRVVLCDCDALGHSQRRFDFFWVFSSAFESDSSLLVDELAASKDGDVLEHSFSVVSERWRFDSAYFEIVLESVEDESCEHLAFGVVGDDEERPLLLVSDLQKGENVSDVRELLLDDQNVAVFEFNLLLFVVSDEVGRNVASVELHAVDELDLVVEGLALLYGYGAVDSYFLVEVGQHVSDGPISVGGDRCYV